MANIYEQIEAYENGILFNIASFLKRLTGLTVYVMDKPFIAPEGPYLTLRIITSGDSGGWSQKHSEENEMFSYVMDNNYDIELTAIRGRPTTMLSYVLAALRGADELKYKYLYSKGIGFLSATSVAQANTVLDGDKTELRARIVLTFNTRMIIEDLPSRKLAKVNMNIVSFREDYNDSTPLVLESQREYVTVTVDNTQKYYFMTDNRSLIKYIPTKDNPSE